MRPWIAAISLAACAHPPAAAPPSAHARRAFEKLAADTPRVTVGGVSFTAPGGWSIALDGPALILETPEPDTHVAVIDVSATSAETAVTAAWALYRPGFHRPISLVRTRPAREGWEERKRFDFETSPDERALVYALALRQGTAWTVLLFEGSEATFERRLGQTVLIVDSLRPENFQPETLAGREASALDPGRVRALQEFVESARQQLGIPGVAFSLVQGGRVVFEGGAGVRALGDPTPVDADTLFMVASNTKALTTLMLGKLVEAGRFGWETPVTSLYPGFKLGNAETTRRVLVKHLVCACTGMPRQDFEWLFAFQSATPASEVAALAAMQPTSGFGEVFQYSNPLAAMAGYLGGHVLYPGRELGAAYDDAMRTLVFEPLGMKRVTFDLDLAIKEDHAEPHSDGLDGRPAPVQMGINRSIHPLRPAGGLWSSVRDLTRYVQLELAGGLLPNGKRYISNDVLLARRAPNVAIGQYETYGMGLTVDHRWGLEVVRHGGSMLGYKSEMMWLPGAGVGAVLLTNANNGNLLLGPFQRRLLELLYDGKPEAVDDLAIAVRSHLAEEAQERERLVSPPGVELQARVAARYFNAALGALAVRREGAGLVFDFGAWHSAVAARKNDDGTLSLVTVDPGVAGFDFLLRETGGERTLLLRDAQHEYVFAEAR